MTEKSIEPKGARTGQTPELRIAGKPPAFWDRLLERPQPVRKPDPPAEATIARLSKKEMEKILAGIRNSNHTMVETSFEAARKLFPDLCVDDVIEICNAGMQSTFDAVIRSAMNALANVYLCTQKENERILIDESLVKVIKVCEKNRCVAVVGELLEKNGLSDAVIIEGIKVCGKDGLVGTIAGLLERDCLSDEVKAQIEMSLIEGINICERNGWVDDFAGLLKRNDLSDRVMIEAINACERGGWIDDVVRLLKRRNLSDAVKSTAERVVAHA